jgi:tRNA pseudouridine55 synthase
VKINNSNKRSIDGILILDKPKGLTSNAALQTVKRLFKAKKAGHSGSLDPIATGLLPICFGEATKFSRFLLESDKYYRLEAKLGLRTDSGDSEGAVIEERPVPSLSLETLEKALDHFRGPISQVPSMYSAIKHKGQPLYKLARQGLTVERAAREITIYSAELLSYENDILCLDVKASKGTYIRTLVDDLGELLGCGAHVISLRRLGAGPYTANQMVDLPTLMEWEKNQDWQALEQQILPLETALSSWPELSLSEAAAFYLRQGQPVAIPYSPSQGWVKLLLRDREFFGVGELLEDGRVAPRRLVASN